MACDHKRSHLGVDFGNFQQYLCMHSTHKNAVCYYSLEIISLIWLPMAANYAMQHCYGCAVYCLSVKYTYALCKVYLMSQRSCFGKKTTSWNQKYFKHTILNFLCEINHMTFLHLRSSSSALAKIISRGLKSMKLLAAKHKNSYSPRDP